LQSNVQTQVEMPFILPHEIIHYFVTANGIQPYLFNQPSKWQQLCDDMTDKLNLPKESTVHIGIHGDGVPFSKSDSIEILAINFLAQPKGQRVPFTAVSKKHLCKCGCLGRHTWYAILGVFKWSMLMLLAGTVSKFCPDGSDFGAEAYKKLLRPGFKLCCHALLGQIRADWPFLSCLFNVPTHASSLICWLCKAGARNQPNSYTDCRKTAGWRSMRYVKHEFWACLLALGVALCPILELPGISEMSIVLDWLHVMDLGVSQDILGCFFWELIVNANLLAGATQDARLKSLWTTLRSWYATAKAPCRLDHLTKEMIRRGSGKPKLRAKGAETRYVVPFAASLARSFVAVNEHMRTVAHLLLQLLLLQLLCSGTAEWNHALACEVCQKLVDLYQALSLEAEAAGMDYMWSLKPKVHLMIEMIQYLSYYHGVPSEFWYYRDESFCGYWAKASHRRGGANNPATTVERFLQRYLALEWLDEDS
jgi:hypothetical protein